MTIADILPQIQQLPDAEKWQLVALLTAELTGQEKNEIDVPSEPPAIWSPHDSYQAAAELLTFARSNGVV
jgi:hypothetical protein